MKKQMRILIISVLFCLCSGSIFYAERAKAAETVQNSVSAEPVVTGLQTIDGKTYFFDQAGNLKKNAWCRDGDKTYRTDKNGVVLKDRWKTIDKKKYHFDKKGVRAEGRKKIDGKYYFFNGKGVLKTGTVRDGETTYYTDSKGVLRGFKVKKKYYRPNGKKMSKVDARYFETTLTAEKIAAKITKPGMSRSRKLRICFDWVMKKYYRTRRKFTNFDGWPAVYANDHFKLGSGDCHADASAFAFLAKAVGYDKVYVCSDSKGTHAHSWTEINGKVYDPLFAQAKSFSRNYGVKYGVYKLSPVLHIKLPEF